MSFICKNPHPDNLLVKDCVKRAIIFATGINYRDIAIMLNRYKKVTGASKFNSNDNYKDFIVNVLGGHKNKGDMQHEYYGRRYTVNEFANYWENHTAILRVSKHLVTVKNGNYYDTWDSGDKGVYIAWFMDDYETIVNRIRTLFPKLCKKLTLERTYF